MTVHVVVAVWRGVVDSVECFLDENQAMERLKELKTQDDSNDYDVSVHTCL